MAMLSGPGYPISRSTGVCVPSGRRFENGERYVATLVEKAGEEAFERRILAKRSGSGEHARPTRTGSLPHGGR